MKIRCEVLEVSTDGENLCIKMQGRTEGGADWRPTVSQTIRVPDLEKLRRAYYVGRVVYLTVEAKP